VAFGASTAGAVAMAAGAWDAAVGEAAAAVPTCWRDLLKPSSVDSFWRVGAGCKGATAAAVSRTTRAADCACAAEAADSTWAACADC